MTCCGRLNKEVSNFQNFLLKTRTIPARLRASFTNALIHRWSAQITHAAMSAYATNLLEFDCVASAVTDGNQPVANEVLAEATFPPAASRVPRFRFVATSVNCPKGLYWQYVATSVAILAQVAQVLSAPFFVLRVGRASCRCRRSGWIC